MWTYLPEPHNSIAVWSLVGDAWGVMSYDQIVEHHKTSTTLAIVEEGKFIALANLQSVHATTSCWLMVWLCEEWRRKPQSRNVWQELHRVIFKDMGFVAMVAVSRDKRVARLAMKIGAKQTMVIKHLYGRDQHGHLAVWDES